MYSSSSSLPRVIRDKGHERITFARRLQELGVTTGNALRRRLGADHRPYTLAHTFPTGTHALWLYYWLASHGIDPLSDVHTIVVPPPQMMSHLRSGKMDGACVGEPWNALAIREQVGFTVANSQDVWADHPEKALGTTREFVQRYPNTARALVMAVLEASRYADTMARRSEVARIIAARPYVNAPVEAVEARLKGEYDDGIGKRWHDAHHLRFYRDGEVNFPFLSDGMWFLTQHRRWGLLHRDPDYPAVASRVQQVELYKQAAAQVRVPVPGELMRRSRLIDGIPWDGTDPRAYAQGFSIKWRSKPLAAEA